METPKNRPSGNIYDRIFKENAESLFIPLIEARLGTRIKDFRPLKEKLHITIEREMDFFYEVNTEEGKRIYLHIEFQTQDDEEMIYRMSEYHGIVLRKYREELRHFTIFLGTSQPGMRTDLREQEQFRGFELINIHALNTSELLGSQVPEVILLAILSHYEPEQAEVVLRLILSRLKAVCKRRSALKKYLTQLLVLSRLRKLEPLTTKMIEEMPITYDITQDELYLRGMEKGISQGISQGISKGIDQGIDLTQERVIRNAVAKGLDNQTIADLTGLSLREVARLIRKWDLRK